MRVGQLICRATYTITRLSGVQKTGHRVSVAWRDQGGKRGGRGRGSHRTGELDVRPAPGVQVSRHRGPDFRYVGEAQPRWSGARIPDASCFPVWLRFSLSRPRPVGLGTTNILKYGYGLPFVCRSPQDVWTLHRGYGTQHLNYRREADVKAL